MDNINTAIYDLLWQKGPEDSRFSVPIPDTILYRHKWVYVQLSAWQMCNGPEKPQGVLPNTNIARYNDLLRTCCAPC